MRTLLTVLVFMMILPHGYGQLSPLFAQFGYNPLPLNPAVAGNHGNLNVTLSNRTSFNSTPGTPSSQFFCVHSPLGKNGVVGGLEVINDQAGLLKNQSLCGIGGYQLEMKESALTAAVKVGMSRESRLWSQSITTTLSDPLIVSDESLMTPLVSCGIYYYDKRSYFGVSQSATNTLSIQTRGLILHGGYKFGKTDGLYMQPSFVVRYNRASEAMSDINFSINHDRIGSIGFSARTNQSYAAVLRIVFSNQLWTSVSMDFYSKMNENQFRNTVEISLNYDLIRRSPSPNPLLF